MLLELFSCHFLFLWFSNNHIKRKNKSLISLRSKYKVCGLCLDFWGSVFINQAADLLGNCLPVFLSKKKKNFIINYKMHITPWSYFEPIVWFIMIMAEKFLKVELQGRLILFSTNKILLMEWCIQYLTILFNNKISPCDFERRSHASFLEEIYTEWEG